MSTFCDGLLELRSDENYRARDLLRRLDNVFGAARYYRFTKRRGGYRSNMLRRPAANGLFRSLHLVTAMPANHMPLIHPTSSTLSERLCASFFDLILCLAATHVTDLTSTLFELEFSGNPIRLCQKPLVSQSQNGPCYSIPTSAECKWKRKPTHIRAHDSLHASYGLHPADPDIFQRLC